MAYYIFTNNKKVFYQKLLSYHNKLYDLDKSDDFNYIEAFYEKNIFKHMPENNYTDTAMIKIDPNHIISEEDWGIYTDSFVIEEIYQLSDRKIFQMLLDVEEIRTNNKNIHDLAMWACKVDYLEVIKLLDEMGFDLTFEIDISVLNSFNRHNHKNKFIHCTDYAGYNRSYNVMEYLIDLGIKVDIGTIINIISRPNINNFTKKLITSIDDTQQYNILMCVAASFKLEIFQYLVDLGADLSYDNYSVFVTLTRHGNNLDIIKYVFDRIDVQDFLNVEQIHKDIFPEICRFCNIEIIQYFIDIGINVNNYDRLLEIILYDRNNIEKMKCIINAGYHNGPDIIYLLGIAARNLYTVNIIEFLLGLCPNSESVYPVILQEAIYGKSSKIIKWLIQQQYIDVTELTNHQFRDIIDIRNIELIQFIIDNGYDIYANGEKNIRYFASGGFFNLAQILSKSGIEYVDNLDNMNYVINRYNFDENIEECLENPLDLINEWISNGIDKKLNK